MSDVTAAAVNGGAFKIDKGIPVPTKYYGRGRGGGRPWKWPFPHMEVGDSFAVRLKEGETTTQAMRRVDYVSAGKRLGRKFTARSLEENGVRVVRIWRVA